MAKGIRMSQGFNELEQAVLNWFKHNYHLAQLSSQIDSAKLIRRDWTEVGFYVYLDVPREQAPIDLKDMDRSWPINGPNIKSAEIPNGGFALLWGTDGYIACIEMCSYAGEFNAQVRNFELSSCIS